MVPWAQPSQLPEQRLDWISLFAGLTNVATHTQTDRASPSVAIGHYRCNNYKYLFTVGDEDCSIDGITHIQI